MKTSLRLDAGFGVAALAGAVAAAPAFAQTDGVAGDPGAGRYVVVLVLLFATSALFYYLFDWWRGIDRSSSNYQVFKDAIFNREFEYRRSEVDIKYKSGTYVQELFEGESKRAAEWLKLHPIPAPSDDLKGLADSLREKNYDVSAAFQVSNMVRELRDELEERFTTTYGATTAPAYGDWGSSSATLSDEAKSEKLELTRKFEGLQEAHRRNVQNWLDRAEAQIKKWYQEDLEGPRREAEKFAASEVAGSDFASLRGRGPEFILEFTALVILIISATVLGLSNVLKDQQIGTLLAAIAGYVLGKGTGRSQAASENANPPAGSK